MSDLQVLARKKAEAQMHRIISALPDQIEAVKRELSAKGLTRSGATLKRTRNICLAAIKEQSITIIAEYRWAAEYALFASQTWIEELTVDAIESMQLLFQNCESHLRKAAEFTGTPELEDRLLSDLNDAWQMVTQDIALALHSSFAERRRGLIKLIPGFAQKLLGRFFTGGTI